MQEESPALNVNSLCAFPDSLAWLLPDPFAALSLPTGIAPQATAMDAALSAPLNISPETAITTWSSAPITDWPSTPLTYQKREALADLSKCCPHVNEDVLLIALEELNYVVSDAKDLLLGVGMDDAMSSFLFGVFPQVPHLVITDRVSVCYGRYFETFTSLVKEFHPYWNPKPFAPSSALSLSLPTAYKPDFTSDGSIEMDKESGWWSTLANTVRWQVSDPSPDNHTWSTVVTACMLGPKTYSPRLANLASKLTGPDCRSALSTLVLLPAYSALIDLAAHPGSRAFCTRIVHVLVTHGMASPGAVAWLYECASTDAELQLSLQTLIPLYLKLSSSIWATRNTVLYAYRAEASLPRSGQSFIDIDALSVISSLQEPDDESVALAPISPSVSRATRTSTGSKSKKPVPYPLSKPLAQRCATDDDVRAAQTLVRPLAPVPSAPGSYTSLLHMAWLLRELLCGSMSALPLIRSFSCRYRPRSPSTSSSAPLFGPLVTLCFTLIVPRPLFQGQDNRSLTSKALPPAHRRQPDRSKKGGKSRARSDE